MISLFYSLLGAFLIVVAYYRLVRNPQYVNTFEYHLANFVGAGMLAISFVFGPMNWGSFILQLVFMGVAVRGMHKNK